MDQCPTIMIQGTSSSVGKSLLTAALCRIFSRKGLRVAPFKAQNMSLNVHITQDGGEIGVAQAIQASAAGVAPHVSMNPILLKPEGHRNSQVVVEGQVDHYLSSLPYQERKHLLTSVVKRNLDSLRAAYDLVVIEGAGSPAEINLKHHDIVNMFVAKYCRSPVLLVGDIDRGGVFASLIGTLQLLDPEERHLVKGFLINKFRGDVNLLTDGLDFLENYTKKPVLGVIPAITNLAIAEEDSLSLENKATSFSLEQDTLKIAVVRLPRLSNFDEFEDLESHPRIDLIYTCDPNLILDSDLCILPGSKCTMNDLVWLKQRELDSAIKQRMNSSKPTMAICGGYQMLGTVVRDPERIESINQEEEGLGSFPFETRMTHHKHCHRVRAKLHSSFLGIPTMEVSGYEIHCGITDLSGHTAFTIESRGHHGTKIPEGVATETFLGTLIHGLFRNPPFRQALLNHLTKLKGIDPIDSLQQQPDTEINRLADTVEDAVSIPNIEAMIFD
ncbi:MAG: cobyric acid synthase [Pseudobacteriovorax sp.]|nr:cobyric acid synthase [Pseudobacteriovorax sp.]